MSSLARRSIRTTAAAAGLAALGVGLAGHAFAVPGAALPGAPAVPGADALGAVPEPGGGDTVAGPGGPDGGRRGSRRVRVRGAHRLDGDDDARRRSVRTGRRPGIRSGHARPDRVRPACIRPDRVRPDRVRPDRGGSVRIHSVRDRSVRVRFPRGRPPGRAGLDELGLSQLPLAGPGLPQAPAVDRVAGAADLGGGLGQVDGPDVDPGELQGTTRWMRCPAWTPRRCSPEWPSAQWPETPSPGATRSADDLAGRRR